jgi:hypothetical protein
VSYVARAAILREIECREHDEALQSLKRMKDILRRVKAKRVVGHIRDDRTSMKLLSSIEGFPAARVIFRMSLM